MFAAQKYTDTETPTSPYNGASKLVADTDFDSTKQHLFLFNASIRVNTHSDRTVSWAEDTVGITVGATTLSTSVRGDGAFSAVAAGRTLAGAWIGTPTNDVRYDGNAASVDFHAQAIVAIEVDDWVEETDYYVDARDQAVNVGGSGEYVAGAGVSFTPTAVDEEWLIIGFLNSDPCSNCVVDYRFKIDDTVIWTARDGMHVNDYQAYTSIPFVHLYTAAGTDEVVIEVDGGNGNSTATVMRDSLFYAIKLDSLGGKRATHTPSDLTSDTSPFEVATVTLEDTPTSDVLLLGWFMHDPDAGNDGCGAWFTSDDDVTTLPPSAYKTVTYQNSCGQSTATIPVLAVWVDEDGSEGPTYDLYAQHVTNSANIEEPLLLAIELGSSAGGGGGGASTMQLLGVG